MSADPDEGLSDEERRLAAESRRLLRGTRTERACRACERVPSEKWVAAFNNGPGGGADLARLDALAGLLAEEFSEEFECAVAISAKPNTRALRNPAVVLNVELSVVIDSSYEVRRAVARALRGFAGPRVAVRTRIPGQPWETGW